MFVKIWLLQLWEVRSTWSCRSGPCSFLFLGGFFGQGDPVSHLFLVGVFSLEATPPGQVAVAALQGGNVENGSGVALPGVPEPVHALPVSEN